jgi:hypothetical protein
LNFRLLFPNRNRTVVRMAGSNHVAAGVILSKIGSAPQREGMKTIAAKSSKPKSNGRSPANICLP